VRRLIINADDFGLTSGVNRAIVETHDRGVVSSTTLMANGKAFDGAVCLAKQSPRLGVGCHIVLVDGVPVLEPSQVQSLLQASGSTHFRDGIGKFGALAVLGRLAPDEIEAEAVAQIRKIQSAGVIVTHLDSHKHTHLFPHVLRPLLMAAKACGIRAIRNPFERLHGSQLAASPSMWKRWIEVGVLRSFAKQFRESVQQAGLFTPDGTLAIVATGTLNEHLLRLMIDNLPEGTWEFVCHPGYNDADLQVVHTRLREAREEELRILTSPATRDLLTTHGIEIISFLDVIAAQ
jgi:chitin disaccharide deacetylase